jgi:alkanesulfonate monooxygenase SsuD/methylene tetrahydromethanopterin reductase-like flavin-dependent oxidoreductase (luciferase family)
VLGAASVEAESLGFDTVWVSDLPFLPAVDPGSAVAFVAACTTRLRLGATFIPFGTEPYLVAHRLAQLDRLSSGRLLVAFVPGGDRPAERTALGTAGRHRGRMMEELVPLLHRLWTGQPADGSGVRLPVLPVQHPLEIWLGGSGPDAVARAGRVADGWLGSLLSPEQAAQVRLAIEEEAARVGRQIDPEHFGLSIGYARRPEDLDRAGRNRSSSLGRNLEELVPVGAVALRRLVAELVEEGVSKFVLWPLSGPASTEAWRVELAWLADAVLDMQS